MTVSDGKRNKQPIIFFISVFIVIGIMMFVANYRSILKAELDPPASGVEKLHTVANWLAVISPRKEVYLWDWNRLNNKPITSSFEANNVACLSTDRFIWNPPDEPGTIIVSNLKGDKEYKRFSLPSGWQCEHIFAAKGGEFAVLELIKPASAQNSDHYDRIRLDMISPDLDIIANVLIISKQDDNLSINELAVSDDGAYIAIVGNRKGQGWVAVGDTKEKKLLWQEASDVSAEFINVAFSPDGKIVYAGGLGRYVCGFQNSTGELLRKWQMDEYQTPANKRQHVSCIAASPDGRFLAAGTEPARDVYNWDVKTGDRLGIITVGGWVLNGLTFSPDSLSLATASPIVKQKIKIWQTPGAH